jgi:hypothetical protein
MRDTSGHSEYVTVLTHRTPPTPGLALRGTPVRGQDGDTRGTPLAALPPPGSNNGHSVTSSGLVCIAARSSVAYSWMCILTPMLRTVTAKPVQTRAYCARLRWS